MRSPVRAWPVWPGSPELPSPAPYPVAESLDVPQPGDPLGGVDVGGVGAAVVHLRGHLGPEDGAGERPPGPLGPLPRKLPCSHWHAVPSAGPQRAGCGQTQSWPCWCPRGPPCLWGQRTQAGPRGTPPEQPGRTLTFPALQRHQVALVVQRGDNHVNKVELALPAQVTVIHTQTPQSCPSLHPHSGTAVPCFCPIAQRPLEEQPPLSPHPCTPGMSCSGLCPLARSS